MSLTETQFDLSVPTYAPQGNVIKGAEVDICTDAADVLARAHTRAQRMLNDAQSQARGVLHDTQQQCEALREEARHVAAQEGRNAAAQATALARREVTAQHANLLLQANARLRRTGIDVNAEVVELTLATVRHLFGQMPRGKRVAALALRAVESMQSEQNVELRVHPDILVDARNALREALLIDDLAGVVTLSADPTLSPEHGKLYTSTGMVLVSLEQQLEALAQSLRDGTAR